MKKQLGAGRILANLLTLKGFTTKRQLAEFFGVGPSAVTDWTNRKGDRIPARRLARACQVHGLRWEWLAYGEGPPYTTQMVDNRTGLDLDPAEVAFIERIKSSPNFKAAVDRLLGLPEEQLRIISLLAAELKASEGNAQRSVHETIEPFANESQPHSDADKSSQPEPFLLYDSRYPLTVPR